MHYHSIWSYIIDKCHFQRPLSSLPSSAICRIPAPGSTPTIVWIVNCAFAFASLAPLCAGKSTEIVIISIYIYIYVYIFICILFHLFVCSKLRPVPRGIAIELHWIEYTIATGGYSFGHSLQSYVNSFSIYAYLFICLWLPRLRARRPSAQTRRTSRKSSL